MKTLYFLMVFPFHCIAIMLMYLILNLKWIHTMNEPRPDKFTFTWRV